MIVKFGNPPEGSARNVIERSFHPQTLKSAICAVVIA